MGGWSETDSSAISVQLDLTGTATGTELGNKRKMFTEVKRVSGNCLLRT